MIISKFPTGGLSGWEEVSGTLYSTMNLGDPCEYRRILDTAQGISTLGISGTLPTAAPKEFCDVSYDGSTLAIATSTGAMVYAYDGAKYSYSTSISLASCAGATVNHDGSTIILWTGSNLYSYKRAANGTYTQAASIGGSGFHYKFTPNGSYVLGVYGPRVSSGSGNTYLTSLSVQPSGSLTSINTVVVGASSSTAYATTYRSISPICSILANSNAVFMVDNSYYSYSRNDFYNTVYAGTLKAYSIPDLSPITTAGSAVLMDYEKLEPNLAISPDMAYCASLSALTPFYPYDELTYSAVGYLRVHAIVNNGATITFTECTVNGGSPARANIKAIRFARNGDLIVVTNVSPFFYIYKKTASTVFTRTTNPSTLLNAYDVLPSPNGLVALINASPFVAHYPMSLGSYILPPTNIDTAKNLAFRNSTFLGIGRISQGGSAGAQGKAKLFKAYNDAVRG